MKKDIEHLKKELVIEIKELAADIASSNSYVGLLANEIKFRSLQEKFINLKFLERKQYGLEIFESDVVVEFPEDTALQEVELKEEPGEEITLKKSEKEQAAESIQIEKNSQEEDIPNTLDEMVEADEFISDDTPNDNSDNFIHKAIEDPEQNDDEQMQHAIQNQFAEDQSNLSQKESSDSENQHHVEGSEGIEEQVEEDNALAIAKNDEVQTLIHEDKKQGKADEGEQDTLSSESTIEKKAQEAIEETEVQKIVFPEPVALPKGHKPLQPIQLDFNDQIAFQYQLFGGDQESMDMVIRTLNAITTLADSKKYLIDLQHEMQWTNKEEYVQRLEALVKNRFE